LLAYFLNLKPKSKNKVRYLFLAHSWESNTFATQIAVSSSPVSLSPSPFFSALRTAVNTFSTSSASVSSTVTVLPSSDALPSSSNEVTQLSASSVTLCACHSSSSPTSSLSSIPGCDVTA
jgi:hypothetical protein